MYSSEPTWTFARVGSSGSVGQLAREPEIEDDDPAVRRPDEVVGLEIAVDEAAPRGRGERVEDRDAAIAMASRDRAAGRRS